MNIPTHIVSRCLVDQASHISANSERIRALFDAVGDANSLKLHQWVHFYALAKEYEPDLIIEFGRGYGNSSCLFAEALSHLPGERRVVSLCNSSCWNDETLPKLEKIVDQDWLGRIDARTLDILSVDYEEIVADARRVLVLWDAHGPEVADCVLAKLMPLIGDREHFVVMHDISDARYVRNSLDYAGLPFWRGQDAGWSGKSAKLYLGWIETVVEQVIPAIDFTVRNGLELGSADHQVKLDICDNEALYKELRATYPNEFFEPVNHWAFFTLNDSDAPHTYPRYLETGTNGPQLEDEPAAAVQSVSQTPENTPANGQDLERQLRHDLQRDHWFGRRSPMTYGRVVVKIFLGRYPNL